MPRRPIEPIEAEALEAIEEARYGLPDEVAPEPAPAEVDPATQAAREAYLRMWPEAPSETR